MPCPECGSIRRTITAGGEQKAKPEMKGSGTVNFAARIETHSGLTGSVIVDKLVVVLINNWFRFCLGIALILVLEAISSVLPQFLGSVVRVVFEVVILLCVPNWRVPEAKRKRS